MSSEADSSNEQAENRIAVNCPACKRLFNVPVGSTFETVLHCPFCSAMMRLQERVVIVAVPVAAA
jgi:uncharacterized Zn-finger protein